jgi:hypothetical protein
VGNTVATFVTHNNGITLLQTNPTRVIYTLTSSDGFDTFSLSDMVPGQLDSGSYGTVASDGSSVVNTANSFLAIAKIL